MRAKLLTLFLIVLSTAAGTALGQTWNQIAHVGRLDSMPASSVEALLVPVSGTYLAATDKGISRSTDAGAHWSPPWGSGWGADDLLSLPDGRILAGTWRGLAVSTDVGITWNLVPAHPSTQTTHIARDSQGRLFTGLWGSRPTIGGGVFRSTDNGATWLNVLDSVYTEFVEVHAGDVVYAGGSRWFSRSTDAGQTWRKLYDNAASRTMTVTQNGSILFGWYIFDPLLRMATYRSTDNGATWGWVAGFYSESYATDANNYVYAACDSGARRSTDNGTTWQILNTGLVNRNGGTPWLRTLLRTGATELIAGEYHTGELFRTTDLGAHWSMVSRVESPVPTTARLSGVTFKRPDRLFLSSSVFGMEQWTQSGGLAYVNTGLADLRVQTVHAAENGDVFAGTQTGIYRSTNNGTAWTRFGISSLLMKALADLPNGMLLAGTNNGVLKIAADGSSFTVLNAGLVNRTVNTLFAGTDGRSLVGTEDGLYRLDSVTWTPVSVTGGPLKVTDIDVFGQTLVIAARDSGVYLSTNNGQLWQRRTAGMAGLAVSAVTLTAQDRIYAATENNGVFTTTTGSSTWTTAGTGLLDLRLRGLEIGPGGYLYAISDSGALSRTANPVVTVGEPPTVAPSAFALDQNYPNPFNPSTIIRYALPQRSPVTLAVYNALGQEVAILVSGEKEAGYHVATFDASNFSSGVYFYRLTAGEYVEAKKFVVLR